MLNFRCRYCGNAEIVHGLTPEELRQRASTNTWPVEEFQDDNPIKQLKDLLGSEDGRGKERDDESLVMEMLRRAHPECLWSLGECPGFDYSPDDIEEIARRLSCASDDVLGQLPKHIQDAVLERRQVGTEVD